MICFSFYDDRKLISVSGKDGFSFLQNLITQDMALCRDNQALWTALLSAQGRVLWDFFIYPVGDRFLIDCAEEQAGPLGIALLNYKLRADIDLDWEKDMVLAWVDEKTLPENTTCPFFAFNDPRHQDMGYRLLGQRHILEAYFSNPVFEEKPSVFYLAKRVALGLPEGQEDLPPAQAFPLQNGFGSLNAIAWNKGCYPGQEVTARTKYRGQVKKHLFPIIFSDQNLVAGMAITYQDRPAGQIMRVFEDKGLAMIILGEWGASKKNHTPLKIESTIINVKQPDWLIFEKPMKEQAS